MVASRIQGAVLTDGDGDVVGVVIVRHTAVIATGPERRDNEVVMGNILNQPHDRRLAIEYPPTIVGPLPQSRHRTGCCDDACDGECGCCCVIKWTLKVFCCLLCLPCLPLFCLCYYCLKDD